jgi:hypothetical protein
MLAASCNFARYFASLAFFYGGMLIMLRHFVSFFFVAQGLPSPFCKQFIINTLGYAKR